MKRYAAIEDKYFQKSFSEEHICVLLDRLVEKCKETGYELEKETAVKNSFRSGDLSSLPEIKLLEQILNYELQGLIESDRKQLLQVIKHTFFKVIYADLVEYGNKGFELPHTNEKFQDFTIAIGLGKENKMFCLKKSNNLRKRWIGKFLEKTYTIYPSNLVKEILEDETQKKDKVVYLACVYDQKSYNDYMKRLRQGKTAKRISFIRKNTLKVISKLNILIRKIF